MICLKSLILEATLFAVVFGVQSVPLSHQSVEIDAVTFTSRGSASIVWSLYSRHTSGGAPLHAPPTQLSSTQSSAPCGEQTVRALNRTTHTRQFEHVLWGVDSRLPLTVCLRIYTDDAWQPWINYTVSAQYVAPPSFLVQPTVPENLLTNIWDKPEIRCEATGAPPPTLVWTINGQRYSTLGYQPQAHVDIESAGLLKLDELRELTTDVTIQCVASNAHGTVASTPITIRKPFLEPAKCKTYDLDNKETVNFTAGVVMSCDSHDASHPELEYNWRMCPGIACRTHENKTRGGIAACPQLNINHTRLTASNGKRLVYPYVTSQDAGCYVCESTNTLQDTTCYTTTTLEHKGNNFNFVPKLLLQEPAVSLRSDGQSDPITGYVGEDFTMECLFQARPAPTISWYRQGQEILADARHHFSTNSTALTITGLEPRDYGQYTCRGTNFLDSDDGNFILHVNAKPEIAELPSQTVLLGANVTIACDVTAHRFKQISWYKNEALIDDMKNRPLLNITSATAANTGVYKCLVSDRYGETSEAMTLTVQAPVQVTRLRALTFDLHSDPSTQWTVFCDITASVNANLTVNIAACPAATVTMVTADVANVSVTTATCRVSCMATDQESESCQEVWLGAETRTASEGRACGPYIATPAPEPVVPSEDNKAVVSTQKSDIIGKPEIGHSTEQTKPWYKEKLYVLLMSVLGSVVMVAVVVGSIVWYVRRKKKSRQGVSRLLNYGPGHALLPVQYSKEESMHQHAFVNNSLYPSPFSLENLHNQLKEVEIPRKNLVIGEMIGRGQFGRVYKGTLMDKTYINAHQDSTVAIKTLKYKADECDMVHLFMREALMMRDFHHPHVLSLIGIAKDTDQSPLVVLPYMERGDLRTYISSPDLDFRVVELLRMGVQVANGMAYLENKRFVHRDLAARNCMVDSSGRVRVADFGLSRDLYSGEYYRTEEGKNPLPIRWMAIESLNSKVFSSKSDVWSFGIVLWELVTRGATPYPGIENWAIHRHIQQGHRMNQPVYCPNRVYDMMRECWSETPKLRPDFDVIQRGLEAVCAASAGSQGSGGDAPGAPVARRDTLNMDIRTTRVTKCRDARDNLSTLKEA